MLLLALAIIGAVCTTPSSAIDLTTKLSDLPLDQLSSLVSSELSVLVRNVHSSYNSQKNSFLSSYKKVHQQSVWDNGVPRMRIARSVENDSFELPNGTSHSKKDIYDLIQSLSSRQDFENFAQLLHTWPKLHSKVETTQTPDEFQFVSSVTEPKRLTTVSNSRVTFEPQNYSNSGFESIVSNQFAREFPDKRSTSGLILENVPTLPPLPHILEALPPTSPKSDTPDFGKLSLDSLKRESLQKPSIPNQHREKTDNIDVLERALSSHENELRIVDRHSSPSAKAGERATEEPWRAYSYNTGLYDRERLTVESISSARFPGRKISKVFQVPIGDALLATDSDGLSVLIDRDGHVGTLRPGDGWTVSRTGCPCAGAATDLSCACCEPGSCSCGGQVCAPCQRADPHAGAPRCTPTDAKVRMDVAAAYQEHRQTTIIAAATGDSVALYRSDGTSITALRPAIDKATQIYAGVAISGVALAELPLLQAGEVLLKRFLITFRANHTAHFVQSVILDEDQVMYDLRGLTIWQVSGREMKVLQASERVFIFVSNSSTVTAFELIITSGFEVSVVALGSVTMGSAITSWHCFLNLGQPFLVLSDPDKAALFSVIQNKIIETQVLRAAASDFRRDFFESVLPVDSGNYRGDAALLISALGDVHPFIWHPQAHIFRPASTFPTQLPQWTTYGVLQGFDDTKVIGASVDGTVHVVTIRFTWARTPDPALAQYNEASAAVAVLQERQAGQHAVLRSVLGRLKRAVHLSSVIDGNIAVRGVVEAEEARVSKLRIQHASVMSLNDKRWFLSEHQKKLEDEELALNDAAERLQKLQIKFEHGVEQHSLEASIDGRVFFTGVSASLVDAESFISERSSLQDIVCDLVESQNPLTITGKKVFRGPLGARSLQATSLDAVQIDDFITETSDAILENVTYIQGFTVLNSFEVAEGFKVGGKELTNSLLTSDNALLSTCFFEEVRALGGVSSFRNEINGVDLETLRRSILTNQRDVTLSGSLQFSNDVSVKGDASSPVVMGVDMNSFFANVLMKNSSQRYNLSLEFESQLEISGNVVVNGRVNGHYFPSEYPNNGNSFGIFENKVFEDLSVEKLIVPGTVDKLRTEDIITLSTNQIVFSHKVFSSGIEVEGDLNVNNFLVDGVNLQNIGSEAGRKKVEDVTYNVVFQDSVVFRSLNLDGLLNNFNFFEVAKDLVLKTDTNVEIYGRKLFEGRLTADRVNTDTINFLPVGSFISSDQPFSISGQKTFKAGFTVSDLEVDGYIGDVNLTNFLLKSLYKNKPGQIVTGNKIFAVTSSGSRLVVEETINDINFNNIATKSRNNTFSDEQSFNAAVFNNLNSSNLFLPTQVINDIDIGVLNSTVMYVDSVQNISGRITCTGNVIFESFLKLEYLNGFPLVEFLPNLVIGSENTWVHSELLIDQIEVKGNIFTKDKAGFSNVNISNLNEEAIKLDAEILDPEGFWQHLVFLSGAQFDGLVNGRTLTGLLNDSVFASDAEELNFSGTKTFSGKVAVSGNVSAAHVNDLYLPSEAFTKTTHQLVVEAFEFTSMRVENITFIGRFNGLDVGDLLATRLVADVDLQGPVAFTSDVSVGSLEVDGYVDGVDVVRLLEDLIHVNDTGVEVTGEKTIFSSSQYHELFVDDLNGENFDVMADDLVKSDEDNHFNSSFRITNVTSPVIMAESVVVHGFVEGENPEEVLHDLIHLNKREVIRDQMTFEHLQVGQNASEAGLSVGSLNGRSPLEDFLLTDTVQSFRKNVEFLNLTTKDVVVGELVNGWKLDRLTLSLKHAAGQTIRGNLVLPTAVAHNLSITGLCGPSASLDLKENVIRLDTNSTQLVRSQLNFAGQIKAMTLSSSTNTLNGVDIKALAENAWSKTDDSVVTGNFTFRGPVIFEKDFIFGDHSLSALSSIARQVEDVKEGVRPSIKILKETYVDQCQRGSAYVDVLKKTSSKPSGLQLVSSVQTNSSVVQPLLLQLIGVTYLFLPPPPNTCDLTLLRWSDTAASFEPWATVRNLGVVTDWVELTGLNSTLVAVAVSVNTSNCANASSLVLRVSEENVEILHTIKGWNSVSWAALSDPPVLHVGSPSAPRGHIQYAFAQDRFTALPVSLQEPHQHVRVWTEGLSSKIAWARARDEVFDFGINNSTRGRIEADVLDASVAIVGNSSVVLASVFRDMVQHDKPYVLQIIRPSQSEPGYELLDSLPLDHPARVSLVTTHDSDHILVVTTDSVSSPRLHWLRGSGQLRRWREGEHQLETRSNASWSGYFRSEGSTFLTVLSSEVTVHKMMLEKISKLQLAKKIHCPFPKVTAPQLPSVFAESRATLD